MTPGDWFQWYYVIYWLPLSVGALLLLLSGVGGHHGAHGHAGHGLHFHGPHGAGGLHGGHGVGHAHGLHSGGGHSSTSHGAAAHGHSTHTSAGHSAHDSTQSGSGQRSTVGEQSTFHPDAGGNYGPDGQAGRVLVHAHSSQGEKELHLDLSVGSQLLAFFGLGRAPLTILLGGLTVGWGLVGLLSTQALQVSLKAPSQFVLPVLGAAAVGAFVLTKVCGEIGARLMSDDYSSAVTRDSLVGLTGTVVYPVSDTGGRVHIFDQFRTLHVEPARIRAGRPPVPKGAEVLVIQVDPEKGHLVVDSLEPGGPTLSSTANTGSNVNEADLQER